jgi:hypothetical protein
MPDQSVPPADLAALGLHQTFTTRAEFGQRARLASSHQVYIERRKIAAAHLMLAKNCGHRPMPDARMRHLLDARLLQTFSKLQSSSSVIPA